MRFESGIDARTIDIVNWAIFDWSPSTIRIGCGHFDKRFGATVDVLLIVILFGHLMSDAIIIVASLHILANFTVVGFAIRLF